MPSQCQSVTSESAGQVNHAANSEPAGAVAVPESGGPLAPLKARLRRDGFVRLMYKMAERYAAARRGVTLRELTPCTGEALDRLLSAEPAENCLAATDGLYSMTGGSPPLAELDRVARGYGGALYIDDAHGTGVYGPRGRGVAA